ncbi:TPA: ABC transporter permease, partial [Streptococcus pyogenes]
MIQETSFLKHYYAFIKLGLQQAISYRTNFYLYRIGDVLGVLVSIYLWKAVFLSSKVEEINNFNSEKIIYYIIISYITQLFVQTTCSIMIGEDVKEGSISMRLLKPVDLITTYLFTEIGEKLMVLFTLGIPITTIMIIIQCKSNTTIVLSLLHIIFYIFSIINAYLINFYINICFGFSSFILKNLWGVNFLKNVIVSFLSGSVIPLSFFPDKFGQILQFLPFSSMNFVPVMLFLGKYNALSSIRVILVQ